MTGRRLHRLALATLLLLLVGGRAHAHDGLGPDLFRAIAVGPFAGGTLVSSDGGRGQLEVGLDCAFFPGEAHGFLDRPAYHLDVALAFEPGGAISGRETFGVGVGLFTLGASSLYVQSDTSSALALGPAATLHLRGQFGPWRPSLELWAAADVFLYHRGEHADRLLVGARLVFALPLG